MGIELITKANIEKVVDANDIVFLDFWAEWCAPCKAFSVSYHTVAKDFPEIVFGQIDVDSETELAKDFEVRSIPMLVVFKKGVIIYADTGNIPESTLRELVTQAQTVQVQ